MAETTKIEWTDATWNPITGCSVVSPGCTNCYAMRLAGGRMQHHPSRAGLTQPSKAGPVWTGEVRLNEEWLDQPLRWKRPRRIFVCAHGDLFHENVPDEWIDRVFAVMALAPQHTFQVLTKRTERMRKYLGHGGTCIPIGIRHAAERMGFGDPGPLPIALPNVWLGVSVEDQPRADERIRDFLAVPAAVHFISVEPMLGPVRLDRVEEFVDEFTDCGGHPDPQWPSDTHDATWLNALEGQIEAEARAADGARRGDIDVGLIWNGGKIDWVIVGGESGLGSRPMHPDWVRSLRDQCHAAGTAFFFKQWGDWLPRCHLPPDDPAHGAPVGEIYDRLHVFSANDWSYRLGKRAAGRTLDGRTWDQMPEASP